MRQHSIEARSYRVLGVASHDFWVLRDENGKALAELHGLATDRQTGEAVPIGTNTDRYSLRVWELAHDAKYAETRGVNAVSGTFEKNGQPYKTVLTSDSEEVMARWGAAAAAKQPLNALDLDYPSFGINLFKATVNSNSTYRTLGEIMGVPVPDFPGRMAPGIDHCMVRPTEIRKLRTHGYPVLNAAAVQPPVENPISPQPKNQ